jgi:NADPH:quinone reductase-like Zn-dependent oxidoreductase
LAGVVAELGSGVSSFAVGDEVIGFSMRRSSHAEYVTVPVDQLTAKPSEVSWEVAGSLFVAGATAYAAVRAVRLVPGETVAIAGAAGGVGSIAVQLARRSGATVLGIAGPANDAWLADHGAVPVNYGDDLPARLRAAAPAGRIDAMLDFFGGGYVAMAVEDLNVPPERVDTIADFPAVERFGVQSAGGADAATAAVVAELADLVARGELEVPIAGVFALDDVRDAFREVELRHTRGKLVLRP